jgi:hypothetical protein
MELPAGNVHPSVGRESSSTARPPELGYEFVHNVKTMSVQDWLDRDGAKVVQQG